MPRELQLGDILDSRYRVIEPMGSGAFGQTYLVADTKRYDHHCVLKQLRPLFKNSSSLGKARELFEREARALYHLGKHDQIPELFAYFEEDREFYLVQQFIEGQDLTNELNQPWSETEVISFLQDVLTTVQFIHENQVLHRDFKPANLMRRSSDRKIVLIDFGSVKLVQALNEQGEITSEHTTVAGTPEYMPHEQMFGDPSSYSDIYAIGITAIQFFTGTRPLELDRDGDLDFVWHNKVSVSEQLAAILTKMVRYECSNRYQNAAEVLADLNQLQEQSSNFHTLISGTSQGKPPSEKKDRFLLVAFLIAVLIGAGFLLYFIAKQRKKVSDQDQAYNLCMDLNNRSSVKDLTQALSNCQFPQKFHEEI